MRLVGASLLLAALLALAPAAAHTEGGAGHAEGTFTLAGVGGANYKEWSLSDLGLTPAPRSLLEWTWSVAGGTAVYFDVHSHPPGGDAVVHYTRTAGSDAGSWTLPGGGPYWVFWSNPTNAAVNVTYAIQLHPPSVDTLAFWLVPILAIGGAVAVLGLALRRGKKPEKADEPEP